MCEQDEDVPTLAMYDVVHCPRFDSLSVLLRLCVIVGNENHCKSDYGIMRNGLEDIKNTGEGHLDQDLDGHTSNQMTCIGHACKHTHECHP